MYDMIFGIIFLFLAVKAEYLDLRPEGRGLEGRSRLLIF